jgi:hypothetical protein
MKNLKYAIACALLALTACSGGGSGAVPNPNSGSGPQSVGNATLTLTFPVGPTSKSTGRKPQYVSPNSAKVVVTINTVNGNAPAADVTPNPQTIALSTAVGGNCAVSGGIETCTLTVLAPAGSVSYTIAIEDASGNVLSTSTQTFTINLGQDNNSLSIVLQGVATAVTIAPMTMDANTPISSAALTVTATDASGATITGSGNFANQILLTDSDTSGATSLQVNSGLTGTTVAVNSVTDVVKLSYSGLAIPGFTITASAAPGLPAITGSQTFTPVLNPITFGGTDVAIDSAATGGLVTDPNWNQETLFFAGIGPTETFTAAELGWSNSPFNQSFAGLLDSAAALHTDVPTSTCGSGASAVATISGGLNTTFSVTSKNDGICKVTVSDGAGQSALIWISVTSSGITVQ